MTEETKNNPLPEIYMQVLEENKEALKTTIKNKIEEKIMDNLAWGLPDVIQKEINEFLETEIAPAIREHLMTDKEAIVDHATTVIAGVPAELGKAMQEKLAKNMADSWKLEKVVKAMFD